MAATFLHNREWVNIDDGILKVQMKLSDFNYFEPDYSLEPPYLWQYYIQGSSRTKHTSNTEYNFPIPWADGDTYISKVAFYLANLPIPPQTLEEAKQRRTTQLYSLWSEKNSGNIKYTGMSDTIFPSIPHSANALITYKDRGIVPIGFTKPDKDGNHVVMTLAQLLELNAGIVDLFYLNELNLNIHAETIQTLTTIPDVMAYNITTGWPTLPFEI
jgi:hypothetical protein